jgi:hypothetical protein
VNVFEPPRSKLGTASRRDEHNLFVAFITVAERIKDEE